MQAKPRKEFNFERVIDVAKTDYRMAAAIEKDKTDAAPHPLAALLKVLQTDSRIPPEMQEAILGAIADVEANKVGLARAGPSRRATNTSGGICGNFGGRDYGRANCPDNCNVKGCGKPANAHVRTCPWHPSNIEQRRQERLAERLAAHTDRTAPPPPAFRQNFGGRACRAQQRRDAQAHLLSIKESKASLHVLLASFSEADRPRLELFLKDTMDSEPQMTAALLELGPDSDGDYLHYGSDEDSVASLLAS